LTVFFALYTVAVLCVSQKSSAVLRDELNPLGIPSNPRQGNVLKGITPFVDRKWGFSNMWYQRYLQKGDRARASLMKILADFPETKRYGPWTPLNKGPVIKRVGPSLASMIRNAKTAQPGSIPMILTYMIVPQDQITGCHNGNNGGPAFVAYYKKWINAMAHSIGSNPIVIFLEMDAGITVGCLSKAGMKNRATMMSYAVKKFMALPHTAVYIDAGANDALSPAAEAKVFKAFGGLHATGFFLGSTHNTWIHQEVAYAIKIKQHLGAAGKKVRFVINTANNGAGPVIPKNRVKNGNEVLGSYVKGRALGHRPTSDVPPQWEAQGLDGVYYIGNAGAGDHGFDPNLALRMIKIALKKKTLDSWH